MSEELEVSREVCEQIDQEIENLYNLNAEISLHFVGLKKPVTHNDIEAINQALANSVKSLREICKK